MVIKAWMVGTLGLCVAAVIVLGYEAIDLRAPGVPNRPRPVGQVADPTAATVPSGNRPSEATEPAANVEERSPLPASLQEALDHDPSSRIAQFHAQMAREARDPAWAAETEYQLQVALHEAAPKLLGRVHLQTTCASSMCEMVGVIDGAHPEQASRDARELQLVLNRVPASDVWTAMDLERPVGSLFTPSSEGGRTFIVEFPKKRLAAR